MYNSGQKIRFMGSIQLQSDKKAWAENIFNATERTEAKLGKDISVFSADEVGDALSSPGVTSSITVSNRIPFIVRYKKWCMENGIDAVVISSSDIRFDFSGNIRNSMVYSPSNLDSILGSVFRNRRSVIFMDSVYCAYLWFAFSGMYELDAVQVRERDVNLRDLVVAVKGRWYGLRAEGAEDIRTAMKVESVGHIMKDGSVRIFRRADGDCVVRGRKTIKKISPEDYVTKTLRSAIQESIREAGCGSVSFVKVQKSGIFYTMLEREVRGFMPNFYTFACDDYDRGNHKDTSADIRQRTIARTNLNYKRDYAAWKTAFKDELMEEFKVDRLP